MIRARDALAAANAFKEAVGGNVVPAEEIRRRFDTCNGCPMKAKTKGLLPRVSQVLGLVANKHRVPVEIAGYSCGVCGCSLLMLLPAEKADLHKDSEEEAKKRPDSCWFKTA